MSGSPVYIDGKLVGAVALSFPFSKEALTGITPIQDMLEVVPEGTLPATRRETAGPDFRIGRTGTDSADTGRLIPGEDGLESLKKLLPSVSEGAGLAGPRVPLRLGGFRP